MSEIAAQPVAEYQRYTRYQRLSILVGITLGIILVALDSTIVNVAIPVMMGNLGVTMDQISWVSIGYMLTNVIVMPMTGWLEMRFGRRKLLVFSLIMFTVTSLLCGTASTLGVLILYRVLQGIGGAALMSTGLSTLLEVFPPERAGLVTALVGTGVLVGPALGPIVGGYLVDNYAWPWIFYVNVLPGIAAIVVLWVMMKEPQTPADLTKPIDIPGIILLSSWLGCLLVMLEKGERLGWMQSRFIIWLTIISLTSMGLFIYRMLTTNYPIVNLRIFKNQALAAGCICSFVSGVGLFATLFVLPVFLQNLRGYTAQQSGVIMLTWVLASTVAMMISGMAAGKIPTRILVVLGTISCSCSMYAMNSVTYLSGPEHIFWPQVWLGVGIGFLIAPLMTASLAGLKGSDLGDGSGLFNMTRQLGGTIGIALLSTILTKRIHLHDTMLAEHVNIYDPEALSRFTMYQHAFMSKGSDIATAQQQSLFVLKQTVMGQAVIMSYNDLFLIIAVVFALVLPFILFLKDTKPGEPTVKVSMH